ncbi:MAG: hypothetical protein P4L51_29715 [Puia sp.]|nr:hypothetical protein [Puia sp.]
MADKYADFIKKMEEDPEFVCPVCGSSMYVTDFGNHEFTFHCSSEEARFWDFGRGTREQSKSKQHWDQSRHEVFLDVEEAMHYVLKYESLSPGNPIPGKPKWKKKI